MARKPLLGVLAWGFAEATLFFIVPDVLLKWVALTRLRVALGCCLAALGRPGCNLAIHGVKLGMRVPATGTTAAP